MTYRFTDGDFPAGNGKPVWFHEKSTPQERRRAWFDEYNHRNGANGEDGAPGKPSSLADEIKASKSKHRDKPGEQPIETEPPPCGTAEEISAEAAETGEDIPQHDAKSDKEAFARLSKLPRAEYDRTRLKEAEVLGVRIATLDREVEALRPKSADKGTQGRAMSFPEVEPWPETVDGAALLNELSENIRGHVVMEVQSADVIALWVVHTYALARFDISPRLGILSPEPRCGKTTLSSILKRLVYRGVYSTSVSASSVFRVVEMSHPTLLIDEVDTFLPENEELRGVLNSGHRCDGEMTRCVGDDHEPRQFSTYSACSLALIGKLPPTLTDRAVVVELRRRLPGEAIRPLRIRHTGHLDVLARKIVRWVADNVEHLNPDPEMPAAVFNRAADNWCALVAISDEAGGDWPGKARAAAVGAEAATEVETTSTILLSDLRDMFDALGPDNDPYGSGAPGPATDFFGTVWDAIVPHPFGSERPLIQKEKDRARSEHIVLYLNSLTGCQWPAWNRGKGINSSNLAKLLKQHGVKVKQIRMAELRHQGYDLDQFHDAFIRYLPQKGSDRPDKDRSPNKYNDLDNEPGSDNSQACQTPHQTRSHNKYNDLCHLSDLSDPFSGNPEEGTNKAGIWGASNCYSGAANNRPHTIAEQGLYVARHGHERLSAFWAELTEGERASAGGQDTLTKWKIIAARAG